MLRVGFVFLGPGYCVPGQTQQERQSGRHEKLQLGQHVENRLSTHTGRDYQHETVDASEPHTLCHVFLGQQPVVRGVSIDGLWFLSRFVAKPFCGRVTGDRHSFRAERRSAGSRVHTQQRAYTQVR